MGVRSDEPAADAAAPPRDEASVAHARGLERSDEVVQQLAVAKYALTVGDIPRAMAAMDAALAAARRSLSDLLAQLNPSQADTPATYAGAMIRGAAADHRPARMQAAPDQRTPPEVRSAPRSDLVRSHPPAD